MPLSRCIEESKELIEKSNLLIAKIQECIEKMKQLSVENEKELSYDYKSLKKIN